MRTQTACAMRNSLAQRQNHKFLQTLRTFRVHFFIFGCAESLAAGYFYVRNSLKLLGAFLPPTIKSGHKFIKDKKKNAPKPLQTYAHMYLRVIKKTASSALPPKK